jgi:flavin reductase (DIM6/NTAB) family NADH-FMN oxidoreductase RutF
MTPQPLDPLALRRAFGAFATGVTVTTTLGEDGLPVGFTANAFASVSLDPPLLLVCLARDAAGRPSFERAGRFAVNVLAAEQRRLSTQFATRGADKFADVVWRAELTGAPVLSGSAAWFDCRTHEIVPAGDHLILIGRVAAFGDRDAAPLGYWRGAYVHYGEAPQAGALRVAAIVERRREALLRVGGGAPRLPAADAYGPASEPASLLGRLRAAGVSAELPFVFASFDAGATHHVVYRGAAPDAADPGAGWRFTPFAALPLEAMAPGEAEMLRRYVEERDAAGDGRYVGEAEPATPR